MNLNRLLVVSILAPSLFIIAIVGASYFPHQAELMTHGQEHAVLSVAIIVGIVPFSFFMHRVFRRVERPILQQNRDLEALLEVGRAVEESLDLDQVLPASLDAVLEATRAEAAEIWLLDAQEESVSLRCHRGEAAEAFMAISSLPLGEGYPGTVAQTGKPVLVHDLPHDQRFQRERVKQAGFTTFYAVPLRRGARTIGVLGIAAKDPHALERDAELRLLELMAEHIAVAIENSQLHREVQTLAIVTERERLAREMHDGLAQVLGYVNTKAQAVKELLRDSQVEPAIHQMEQLESAAQQTYDDVREGILALSTNGRRRAFLESLDEYVRRFTELSDLPTELIVEGAEQTFSAEVEVQLLRIVQESLANIRKHARASHARIRFSFNGDGCRLEIEDDGQGFDPDHLARGSRPRLGLRSMQERASAIDARLTLDAAPGRGSRVIVDLPGSRA